MHPFDTISSHFRIIFRISLLNPAHPNSLAIIVWMLLMKICKNLKKFSTLELPGQQIGVTFVVMTEFTPPTHFDTVFSYLYMVYFNYAAQQNVGQILGAGLKLYISMDFWSLTLYLAFILLCTPSITELLSSF